MTEKPLSEFQESLCRYEEAEKWFGRRQIVTLYFVTEIEGECVSLRRLSEFDIIYCGKVDYDWDGSINEGMNHYCAISHGFARLGYPRQALFGFDYKNPPEVGVGDVSMKLLGKRCVWSVDLSSPDYQASIRGKQP